jgi:hypothetical protein
LKENFDRFTHDKFKEKEMADFRKMFFVFAALVMILAIPASAQITCVAFVANQPTLRQEGITEPAGDVIISCTVGSVSLVGTALAGPQTVSLYVNGTTITSRQLYSGTTAPNAIPTEAALLVNDCLAASGTGVNGVSCSGTSLPAQGFLQNGALVFTGFSLPTTANSSFTLRITNVRVNANAVASGTFITGTILATFPIQNQAGLVLGVAQASLSVSLPSTIAGLTQCTSTPTAGSVVTSLTVKELVQTAFKSPNTCNGSTNQTTGAGTATAGSPGACPSGLYNNVPGDWYQPGLNTESQTSLTGVTMNTGSTSVLTPGTFADQISAVPGQADSSTRIRVNFSNIPAGVTISVPTSVCQAASGCSSTSTSLAQATSGGDTGSFSIASGTISITSSGSVTYQMVNQSGAAIDQLVIPITVTYTYTPPSTPSVGSILISATYAPTSAEVTTLNPSFGIPRFADTSVLTPGFTIAACQSDLLFTFMTNQAGFDTGFEISNTSSDPFGTAAQNGTCTLNWYGNGPAAGTATTTAAIPAGTAYTNLVSNAAPGFQGYMIAVCNFQYGHGFAFISDGYGQPGRGLSQGYLASVIPTPGLTSASGCTAAARCAADASKSVVGQGESLNQ